jgi:signal transduction histidine kinase
LTDHLEGFIDGHRDALLSAQTDEIAQLRDTVDRNLELVQLGLSVEIIDHELNGLYRGIKADFSRLQPLVRSSASAARYVENLRANFQHLEQRYKLMAPLYRGSNRIKSELDGKRIADYVRTFLSHQLLGVGVKLSATSLFESFCILEVAAVVFPVFVNLTDNAIFWLRNVDERHVIFDLVGDVVTVCDTGPGIHETMLASIFEPFVTTRPGGRGLGLYVARANLQRHGHEIWATNDPAFKKTSGACFCIRFHPDSVIRG